MEQRKPKMTQIANIVGLLKDYEYRENLTSFLQDHRVNYSIIDLLNSNGVIQKDLRLGYRLYRCKNAQIAAEHIVYINYNKYRLNKFRNNLDPKEIDSICCAIKTRTEALKQLFDLDYDKIKIKSDNLPYKIVNPVTKEVIACFRKLEDYNAILPLFERMYGMKFDGDLDYLIKLRIAEEQNRVYN